MSQLQEILKDRARVLAQPLASGTTAKTLQVVEFRLAKESYAIEQAYIREVYPLKDLTPLPCTPSFMLGIISVRGQILPVIDIKRFFDLPETGITDIHMAIIVHAENIEFGILADAVTGVRAIPLDTVQSSLPTLSGVRTRYLKGVTHDALVILDVSKIASDPTLIVDNEVETPGD